MAVGDLITQDYQYEYNGLLMGAGTPYQLNRITGLLTPPPVADRDKARDDAWGDFPGFDTYSPRYIGYDIWLDESVDPGLEAEQAIDALVEAHQIARDQLPREWVMQRPDGRGKRYCWARPRNVDFEASYDFTRGVCLGSAQVKAHDPRIYSLGELMVPATILNTTTNIAVNINYDGKVDGAPRFEIQGPATNPIISNQDDNSRAIRLNGTLAAGETLVVDVKRRTITMGVTDVWRDWYRSDNQWWHLVPGVNRITYTRSDAGGPSTVNIFYRNAWMS